MFISANLGGCHIVGGSKIIIISCGGSIFSNSSSSSCGGNNRLLLLLSIYRAFLLFFLESLDIGPILEVLGRIIGQKSCILGDFVYGPGVVYLVPALFGIGLEIVGKVFGDGDPFGGISGEGRVGVRLLLLLR